MVFTPSFLSPVGGSSLDSPKNGIKTLSRIAAGPYGMTKMKAVKKSVQLPKLTLRDTYITTAKMANKPRLPISNA